MDKDKNRDFEGGLNAKEGDYAGESSTRARNRTVMLTPEITGQVRARLQQEMDTSGQEYGGFGAPPARGDVGTASGRGAGFVSPAGSEGGGTYIPAGRGQQSQQEQSPAPVGRRLPEPAPSFRSGVVWSKETPVVGFLVSFDSNQNGEIYELRSGRLIVTSEPAAGGSYMVVADDSVSPMHAILRISATGEVQVLDQLSEFGTHIKRFGSDEEEHISGEKSTIEHGDVIKFGNRVFNVCILALNN